MKQQSGEKNQLILDKKMIRKITTNIDPFIYWYRGTPPRRTLQSIFYSFFLNKYETIFLNKYETIFQGYMQPQEILVVTKICIFQQV